MGNKTSLATNFTRHKLHNKRKKSTKSKKFKKKVRCLLFELPCNTFGTKHFLKKKHVLKTSVSLFFYFHFFKYFFSLISLHPGIVLNVRYTHHTLLHLLISSASEILDVSIQTRAGNKWSALSELHWRHESSMI